MMKVHPMVTVSICAKNILVLAACLDKNTSNDMHFTSIKSTTKRGGFYLFMNVPMT